MTTMYFARYQILTIEPVDVERMTANSVFVSGRRQDKSSQYGIYCVYFQDAKEALAKYWDEKAQAAEREMKRCREMNRRAWALMDGAA